MSCLTGVIFVGLGGVLLGSALMLIILASGTTGAIKRSMW